MDQAALIGSGAHRRLVCWLTSVAPPQDAPSLLQAAETVLRWLFSDQHRRQIRTIDGFTRRCASQEGNARSG